MHVEAAQERFTTGRLVILDGGVATELIRHGVPIENDALWSGRAVLTHPDAVRRVHRDYLDAGADVCTTVSYQAPPPSLAASRGLTADAAADLLRSSVFLARDAVDAFWASLGDDARRSRPRPLVAASSGSYGAYLADGSEYTGRFGVSSAELAAFHASRMAALASASPDLFAIETVATVVEARAALVAMTDAAPGVPCWLALAGGPDGRLGSGEPIDDAIAVANECPACIAVGFNCTAPKDMATLLAAASKLTGKPLVAYPNQGEDWDADSRRYIDTTAAGDAAIAAAAVGWVQLGVRAVGGCCRTTPDTIRAIRRAIVNDES